MYVLGFSGAYLDPHFILTRKPARKSCIHNIPKFPPRICVSRLNLEKREAKRCQAWHSGERIADVPHLPHHRQMDAIFSSVVACAYSIMVQAMTCSLSSFWSLPSFPRAC